MHMQRGVYSESFAFSIRCVEEPWLGWGNLYFTLRCTQLGSDWHQC